MNLYKKGKESVVTKKQCNPSWSGPMQLSQCHRSRYCQFKINLGIEHHDIPWIPMHTRAVRVHPSGLDLDLLRSAKDLEWSSITGTLSTTNNGCHKSRWPSYSNSTELRFRKEHGAQYSYAKPPSCCVWHCCDAPLECTSFIKFRPLCLMASMSSCCMLVFFGTRSLISKPSAYHIVSYCIILNHIILYHIILYSILSYCIILHAIRLYSMFSYHIISYCIILYQNHIKIASYHIRLYHIISNCIALECIYYIYYIIFHIVLYHIISSLVINYIYICIILLFIMRWYYMILYIVKYRFKSGLSISGLASCNTVIHNQPFHSEASWNAWISCLGAISIEFPTHK